METRHWDVIILGAGPAGLALATRLAPRKVLLLEHQLEPATGLRIGESLPGAARVLLQRLGLFEEFQSGNHQERGATIAIWDKEEPVWRDSLCDPCGPGWLLDRRQFEQMLQGSALRSGAKIHYGCTEIQLKRQSGCWSVTRTATCQQHLAPVIVDASGRSARLARRLGLVQNKMDSQLCLHTFLASSPADEDTSTRILADQDGWWYTVRLTTGYRVLAYHLDAKHPQRIALQQTEIFLKRARSHPLLAEVLAETLAQTQTAEVHVRPAGTAVLDIANLEAAGPGFLAIGDAAITFDPISSQGLFHALASAESAATAINASCWRNPAAFATFKQELLAVTSHYLAKLRLTYSGPERFAQASFWQERRNQLF